MSAFSGATIAGTRSARSRAARRARHAETRWAFLGLFGASREPPGVLSGPRGGWMNVECTSQVEPDRKGRSYSGGVPG